MDKGSHTKPKPAAKGSKKWSRRKTTKHVKDKEQLVAELGKRSLIDVAISEGDPMEMCGVEQKRRINTNEVSLQLPEGVLVDQHLLPQ
jgi:hypothetical protein